MRNYKKPELQTTILQSTDVILTSLQGDDNDGKDIWGTANRWGGQNL